LRKSELFGLLSEAYLQQGQLKQAYDALRIATQIDPNVPDNYLALGALCLEHENYDLALEITNIGLKHIPESYALHLQRGAIRAMKGEIGDAEYDFETAVRLAPQEPLAAAALSIAWIQMGKLPQAVSLLRGETRRHPNDATAQLVLAEALLRGG